MLLSPVVAKSLPCWLSQFRKESIRSSSSYFLRNVWYHQIWIQNYLGFIVSDLMKASLSNLNMSVFSYCIQKTLILVLKDHGYVFSILLNTVVCSAGIQHSFITYLQIATPKENRNWCNRVCSTVGSKDFRAFGVALERRMTAATAATAAVNLVCLYTEWLCYVLGRLHSSYIDFLIFLFFYVKSHKFWKF